ncbi:STAS domain-containing protein [Aquimarina sp. SS2-1]|uniref:STAS domain-containing protein n=1 Tax=Aquimarina besae TaxID=3342247 RepID=UPI00367348C3
MELQIHNTNGRIEIKGNFTSGNVNKVKDYFNYLLDHYEEVVMCLNNVHQVDKSALKVLKNIYAKAQKRSKVLFVLGKGNKKVFRALKRNQLTHIFRNDY